MPFISLIPRAFTTLSVRSYAPSRPGIYGLSNSRSWVYIGATENIQEALLGVLQDHDTELGRSGATGFVFELCSSPTQGARCNRLVSEYHPRWSDAHHSR
jgi:hypothetical protein